jgi:large subunit ribosomal protein L10
MTDTMPSETARAPRPEKIAVVDEVKTRLQGSSAALLTEYRGMKVADLAALRVALTAAGADFKVYKNTLVRFAVRDLGLDLDEAMLTGPTAIAFVDGDAAAVAKALRDYARTNPLLIVKGGILGESALSADEARALADLPSREVLLARFAGGLAAPLAGFAGLLQALPRNLAYGLKALIDQGGGPGAPAPSDAGPAADLAPAADGGDAPVGSGDASPVTDGGDTSGIVEPATGAAPARGVRVPAAADAPAAGTVDTDEVAAATAVTEAAAAADVTEVEAELPAGGADAPAAERHRRGDRRRGRGGTARGGADRRRHRRRPAGGRRRPPRRRRRLRDGDAALPDGTPPSRTTRRPAPRSPTSPMRWPPPPPSRATCPSPQRSPSRPRPTRSPTRRLLPTPCPPKTCPPTPCPPKT